MTMNITIDGATHAVTLADNAATQALLAKLQEGPITLSLNTNGDFEIWGSLGFSLPTANEHIDCQPGDVVLYSGSNICIFYGYNSYSYTRLGSIKGLSAEALKAFLKGGQSHIAVTLSLRGATGISQASTSAEEDAYFSLNGTRAGRHAKGLYIKRPAKGQGKGSKKVVL